jgi:hypothetical protein
MGQIAHLRAEVDKLTESLVRISRREVGLPEVPREARLPLEPMPRDLAEYIRGFASTSVQKQMRDVAYREHAQGVPWATIIAKTVTEEDKP